MKKTATRLLGIALLIAALFSVLAGCTLSHTPSEEVDNSFRITSYDVTMSVSPSREIKTREDITVVFSAGRHGIIRDFDLTGGIRMRELNALRDGAELPLSARSEDPEVLSLYLGDEEDSLTAGRPYVYTVEYVLIVPALSQPGYLPLDVLGYDWYAQIGRFTARITCPALPSHIVYSGRAGSQLNALNARVTEEGNTLLVEASDLAAHRGITLDLRFGEGVLTAPPADLTPVWMLLTALGLFALLALLKLLVCRTPLLTSTVNTEAPDRMDPLEMGYAVDRIVDSEDLGALVFWFASEGYLSIDLGEDADDPLLLRTEKEIPQDMPPHRKAFLEGLFVHGNEVRVSSLKNTFYRTADSVKMLVKASAKEGFRYRAAAIGFAAVSVALLGAVGWLLSLFTVGMFYQNWAPVALCAVAAAISCSVSLTVRHRSYKWGRTKAVLTRLTGFACGALFALFAWMFLSPAYSPVALAIAVICASALGMGGGFLLVPSEEYTKQLGQILGFRDFILYTERDKIETMLKIDPALYYRILPYAQVLGVTDAWTDKFKGLDMAPPGYLLGSSDPVFTAVLWSMTFRSLNSNLVRTALSRPSNTGGGGIGGGGIGGGFGGGFGGGGFGGGGGRSF